MKHFAMIGVAALLMGGFYALGSTWSDRVKTGEMKISTMGVTDTVPKKNDTLNKRMPRDTTTRRDTLNRRDSLQ